MAEVELPARNRAMTISERDSSLTSLALSSNPAVIAHLNMLQAIISRLAGNGAQCKTWCLAIVSALFGLAGSKNQAMIAAAVVPIIVLGFVDAAYLGRERAYRQLYNSIVIKIRDGTYTVADSYNLAPSVRWSDLLASLTSWAIWPIYGGILVVYGLVRLIGF
jgi:hypothetical protein